MKNDTNNENNTTKNNGGSATKGIGNVTGNDSTDKCTSRENRDDEGGVGRAKSRLSRAFNHVDEVFHALNTTDITRIITKEHTTKGGKDAHSIGSPGDRGFDTIKVVIGDGGRDTFNVF